MYFRVMSLIRKFINFMIMLLRSSLSRLMIPNLNWSRFFPNRCHPQGDNIGVVDSDDESHIQFFLISLTMVAMIVIGV